MPIDLCAQAELASARMSDTPEHWRLEASADVSAASNDSTQTYFGVADEAHYSSITVR
jgi:outer membrane scaffolding protein for murein synthesis (MipA/OmpV family)